MAKEINNPHDKFFKSFIFEKENAIDFLKTFLPKNISRIIDFDSLSIENTSFVSDALSETFSDAIFKCKLKSTNEDIFISILIEHKSYPDKYVAIQLLNYLANAYWAQLKESNTLQLIIPFIYYHGKENWQYKSIPQIIKNIPDYLKVFIPDFNTVFVNLNTMSETELKNISNLLLLSALYMQKFSFSQDVLITKITDILTIADKHNQKAGNFLKNIFVYFNEIVEIDLYELKSIIASLPKNTKQEIMTTYQLIKKEGKKEGKIEGKIEGIKIKERDVILKGSSKGATIEFLADITGLSTKEVEGIIKEHNKKN